MRTHKRRMIDRHLRLGQIRQGHETRKCLVIARRRYEQQALGPSSLIGSLGIRERQEKLGCGLFDDLPGLKFSVSPAQRSRSEN
jgi:hypothetical protein